MGMINKSQAHRTLGTLALPYRSYTHPESTTSQFVVGSQDLMTSPKGYAERRPGFSDTLENTPTTFSNLQRIFGWNTFTGQFVQMACDINSSNQAVVYKRVVGVDNSFVSIFTDSTANVFDFVVSNSIVYFSNGNVAKKWSPTIGIENWGISAGSVNSSTGPNGVGTGADAVFSGGTAWANPGNITANDGVFSTVTLTQGSAVTVGPNAVGTAGTSGVGVSWINTNNILAEDGNDALALGGGLNQNQTTQEITATSFGFNIPSNATITGILVEIKRHSASSTGSSTVRDNDVTLLKAGTAVGSNKASGANWPTSETFASYGSSSDLWGTSWTPSDVNNSNFGVQLSAILANSGAPSDVANAGVDFVRITVTYSPGGGTVFSDYLQGTNAGFGIGTSNTVLGVLVEVKGLQSVANTNTSLTVQMLKTGNLVGTAKTGTNLGLSNAFVSFGGSSDLWGTTWTANDINQSTFGVSLQAVSNTSGSVTWSIDFIRITVFSNGGPTVTFTGTGLTATIGYQYTYAFGNSLTGHIGSPIAPSNVVKPANQGMSIPLTASTDAQVNQIHLYRSTDSVASGTSAGIFFELPTSPYPNTTQSVTDVATDITLNISSIAPIIGANDPPTPFFGPVYFAGRVWGFKNTQVFFSGLEETITGVPEESFPSGLAGNFWNFDQPVQGLAVAGQGVNQQLMIFCAGKIYGIAGNSLDTFRRFLITDRRGTRNRASITSLGGLVAWVDSSSQIWGTDSNTITEIGMDIRTDLKSITQANCSLTFHTSAEAHWLVLSTGTKLFVFDGDLNQWMPPWSVQLNYVGSYEVSAGNYALVGATSTKALQLNQSGTAGKYNDNGQTYTPIAKFGLKPMTPDFFEYSEKYGEIASQPTRTGYSTGVQVNTNNNPLSDVLVCVDDDPTNAATQYTSISTNLVTPQVAYNRGQGTNIVQNIYSMNKEAEGRFVGVQVKGSKADDTLRLYSMFVGMNEVGAR